MMMRNDIALLRAWCVVLFALLLSGCLFGCGHRDDEWTGAELSNTLGSEQNAPPSYYDSRCFVLRDGRYVYERGPVSATKTGVDVSELQGAIDWEAVASDGIDFAMLRIGYRGMTEGQLHIDEEFERNFMLCRPAGLDRGVYFFSMATSVEEAREEAHYVLDALQGRELEYPVAFDYEIQTGGRIANVSSEEMNEFALAFCEVIEEGGYEAMIYGNGYDLDNFERFYFAERELWLAEYGSYPSSPHRLLLWQYSCTGRVAGIDADVDLNLDLTGVDQ